MEFYNGNKLLNTKDLNKNTPEIFIVTSNRSAGKTTFFNKHVIDNFKRDGSQFVVLYRTGYELSDAHIAFWNDIHDLYFPYDEMTSKPYAKGLYYSLLLNGETCGFALSINQATKLKNRSHVFKNVTTILFDEFQEEYDNYLPGEVEKVRSIHTSIARKAGEPSRYVKLVLIGNTLNLLNPYYSALHITERIRPNTKFLRGNGWVCEFNFNNYAANSLKNSTFNSAFDDEYSKYESEGVYLNNSVALIDKPSGKNSYLLTITYKGETFGVFFYYDINVIYISQKYDKNCNDILDYTNSYLNCSTKHKMMRDFFHRGLIRFSNIGVKEKILSALSIR